MGVLDGLKPEQVFRFFGELEEIPRGSGNTKAVVEYLTEFCSGRGLRYTADEGGNFIAYADGTNGKEDAEPVILQGHMDMVCVKEPGCGHDFLKDPLDLVVEGDLLYANGTSLGGDDGIAVAYMLAILDDPSLTHPPLECLFTNDEEIGLLGAAALDASHLKGRRMVNLDSEDEGIFTCGCAGGGVIECSFPMKRIRVSGRKVNVTVGGLLGGHSGMQIDAGRANSNKIAGRLLLGLDEVAAWSLTDIRGGVKDNAIPNETVIGIVIDEEDLDGLNAYLKKLESDLRAEYAGTDGNVVITADPGATGSHQALDLQSQDLLTHVLNITPHGVRKMSGSLPGLVETSCNAAILELSDSALTVTTSVRSSIDSARESLMNGIVRSCEYLGGSARVYGTYPGWSFQQESPLRETMVETYREMYDEEPVVDVIHAGLECGLFAEKMPGLDAVSIGPAMADVHTASERLSIESAGRVYEYLVELLSRL